MQNYVGKLPCQNFRSSFIKWTTPNKITYSNETTNVLIISQLKKDRASKKGLLQQIF